MDNKPRVLGVITARGGSKGIPGKNVKSLAGKPLIAWTIDAAKKSALITHLIVSTDDSEIASIAETYGIEVPFIRPKELAQDETPHLPVMQHAVREMETKERITFDYAVILQPTSPFRKSEYIDETLKVLMNENTDSAVTLYELPSSFHPVRVKKIEEGRVVPYCMDEPENARRQDYPVAYKRSSDVYAMTRACLMEKGQLYGQSTAGYIVPKERVIDIDTPTDWIVAEEMAKSLA